MECIVYCNKLIIKSMVKYISALLALLVLLLASCGPKEDITPEPREKGGTFQYNSGAQFQGKIIPVHYFVPAGEVAGMPFLIIMHGADRNAREYLAAWAQKTREYKVIAIAPEFSAADFNSVEYNEGNFITSGSMNPPEATTFSLIDKIFEFVKSELELNNDSYDIYGHSAGAQFVHRYLQFYDSPKVGKAITANAGWYTFPNEAINYPYGIKNLFSDHDAHRRKYYARQLIILLGTADTIRGGSLRTTAGADNQGLNRLERGNYFFQYNQGRAAATNEAFNWQRQYVEGVGHDNILMAPAAADILYR